MITLSDPEYRTLRRRLDKLDALEAAGVDNWEGYDTAMELLKIKVNLGSDENKDHTNTPHTD